MNPFEMVVLIVLIVSIAGAVKAFARNRAGPVLPREDTAENTRLNAEVARLNERIRVLERLATDPQKRLADEIESLKDK